MIAPSVCAKCQYYYCICILHSALTQPNVLICSCSFLFPFQWFTSIVSRYKKTPRTKWVHPHHLISVKFLRSKGDLHFYRAFLLFIYFFRLLQVPNWSVWQQSRLAAAARQGSQARARPPEDAQENLEDTPLHPSSILPMIAEACTTQFSLQMSCSALWIYIYTIHMTRWLSHCCRSRLM